MTNKKENPWVAFLKTCKGDRKTLVELRTMYYANRPTENNNDSESNTNNNDILIANKIKIINKKIRRHDELTPEESEMWRAEFRRVLSDDYTKKASKEELLGTYDVWLKRIKYDSGIDEEKMTEFQNTIQKKNYPTVEEFLKDVTNFFDITELYAAKVL